MQNDNIKCGLIEVHEGMLEDAMGKESYVWYDENYLHDDYEHSHDRAQLTFVEDGYQYLYTQGATYLVPQNHVAWIPSRLSHKTSSQASSVSMLGIFYREVFTDQFYQRVHVFYCPPVLREMLLYARKWSRLSLEDPEETLFLKAVLTSLPNFCEENDSLQVPVPADLRLIPICSYLNNNYHNALDILHLAELGNLSVRSLQRIFSQQTGITVQKYHQLIRIIKSIELLNNKSYTLSQVASLVGYKSLPAFTASYTSIMKRKPEILH